MELISEVLFRSCNLNVIVTQICFGLSQDKKKKSIVVRELSD